MIAGPLFYILAALTVIAIVAWVIFAVRRRHTGIFFGSVVLVSSVAIVWGFASVLPYPAGPEEVVSTDVTEYTSVVGVPTVDEGDSFTEGTVTIVISDHGKISTVSCVLSATEFTFGDAPSLTVMDETYIYTNPIFLSGDEHERRSCEVTVIQDSVFTPKPKG